MCFCGFCDGNFYVSFVLVGISNALERSFCQFSDCVERIAYFTMMCVALFVLMFGVSVFVFGTQSAFHP